MRTDFLEWQDVRVKDAVTGLIRLKARLKEYGYRFEQVFVVPNLVVRGYVFAVEFRNKWYALVNAYDFQQALAGLPTYRSESMHAKILQIPISDSENEAMHVMGGIFSMVVKIGIRSYK